MVGVFFHYFIGQGSSQILTVTKREVLLIWGSLADTFYNYREEEKNKKFLYSLYCSWKGIVAPTPPWQLVHFGNDGTGFPYRILVATSYRCSKSSSSASSSPLCSVIFPLVWVFMTTTVCTSKSSPSLCTVWYTFYMSLPRGCILFHLHCWKLFSYN